MANRLVNAHDFHAEGARAAVRIAVAWREGRNMELCLRDRKVKRWD